MRIIVEFVGGPADGRVLEGQVGDGSDAERYFLLTNHGTIGQTFKMVSDYAVETLAQEQLQVETPHSFQRHYYVVSERLEERNEVLIRAEYVERDEEKGARSSKKPPVPPPQPPESIPDKIDRYLTWTAKHLGKALSHYWPQQSLEPQSLEFRDLRTASLTLYLSHQLLRDDFAILAPAPHPQKETPAISLLGIAPSQDWFLAGEMLKLSDLPEWRHHPPNDRPGCEHVITDAIQRLRSFWLHPQMTIVPCQDHVRRVAEHCQAGYALLAGLKSISSEWSEAECQAWWSGCFEGELQDLQVQYPRPLLVQSYPDWDSYYLLAAYFRIPQL